MPAAFIKKHLKPPPYNSMQITSNPENRISPMLHPFARIRSVIRSPAPGNAKFGHCTKTQHQDRFGWLQNRGGSRRRLHWNHGQDRSPEQTNKHGEGGTWPRKEDGVPLLSVNFTGHVGFQGISLIASIPIDSKALAIRYTCWGLASGRKGQLASTKTP